MFGLDWPQDWVSLAVFVALGVVCFASLGVALSHAIPNFDSAPAYVNAAFLPVIFISGVFYDADNAPGFLRGIAEALPLKHLIDGLSGAMVTGAGPRAPRSRRSPCWRCGRRSGSRSRCAASPGTGTAPEASGQAPASSTQVPPPGQRWVGALTASPIPARR